MLFLKKPTFDFKIRSRVIVGKPRSLAKFAIVLILIASLIGKYQQ